MSYIGDETILTNVSCVLDAFAGTCTVARYLKSKGKRVICNTVMPFSLVLGKAYIEGVQVAGQSILLERLNALPGVEGFVYETFSPKVFKEDYAKKIDAVRLEVERLRVSGEISDGMYYVLLASLLEAVQTNALKLLPIETFGNGHSNQACNLDGVHDLNTDLVYLEPYNPRSFHVVNSIADYKAEYTGSAYCHKAKAKAVVKSLVSKLRCKYIVSRYCSDGILSKQDLMDLLSGRGRVHCHENVLVCKCQPVHLPLRPMIQWVGGKGKMMEHLLQRVGRLKFKKYYEPFLGAGSLLLTLQPDRAICSDKNHHIVSLFQWVQKDPNALIEAYEAFCAQHNYSNDAERHAQFYYEIRDAFNSAHGHTLERLVQFLFLNKNCFNSVYRENSKGEFNVSIGLRQNYAFLDKANMLAVHSYLSTRNVSVTFHDYASCVASAGPGDLVYFDPPYDKVTKSGHSNYLKDDFTRRDQEALAKLFKALHGRGCLVMLSNSNTEFIRDLYKGFQVSIVTTNIMVNRDKTKRKGCYEEVIVTNF